MPLTFHKIGFFEAVKHSGNGTCRETRQLCKLTSSRRTVYHEKIKALVAQGKSLPDIKKELGEANPPAGGNPNFASFTEVVYKELTKSKG